MEDYLHYMKTLRSQMNDVEDQAAKSSVEEQMQITTIQTLEKDLELAHADMKRLKEETNQMVLAKGQICSQILEKQRKIASLESDISTLSQTLELIQQEGVSLHAKLVEKRNYYATFAEATNEKLQEQQEWMNSYKSLSATGKAIVIKEKSGEKAGEAEGRFDSTTVTAEQSLVCEDSISFFFLKNTNYWFIVCTFMDTRGNAMKNLMSKLESAKSQLEMASCTKTKLLSENSEVKQSIEQVRSRIADFQPELEAMNLQMLEEENEAFLSDRAGETEYLYSLQQQLDKLKGISDVVKCSCGVEYKVEVNLESGCAVELYN